VVGLLTGQSPKRTYFKLGVRNSLICESCLEKEESAVHILCDCEDIAYLRFHHLGRCCMEPGTTMMPHKKSSARYSKSRIDKGMNYKGKHNRS
jgi:hypothetical protein